MHPTNGIANTIHVVRNICSFLPGHHCIDGVKGNLIMVLLDSHHSGVACFSNHPATSIFKELLYVKFSFSKFTKLHDLAIPKLSQGSHPLWFEQMYSKPDCTQSQVCIILTIFAQERA